MLSYIDDDDLDDYVSMLKGKRKGTVKKLKYYSEINEDSGLDKWDIKKGVSFVNRYSEYSIKELVKLKNKQGNDFSEYRIDEYLYLINKNFSINAITKIPSYEIDNIVDLIKKTEFPTELSSYFTDDIEKYSISVAGKNPVFGADRGKVKTYIKRELLKRPHSYRKNKSYKEDRTQIDNVENINMLYIVKGYVDYFNNTQNIQKISKLIKQDLGENPFSEEGGIVVDGKNGFNFVKVDSRKHSFKNLEDNESYIVPRWFKHIGHVGLYHFHATTDNDSEYSGPSGSVSGGLFDGGDLGVLRHFNNINPYEVHCVITKLTGNKFNADLYFNDVKEGYMGGKINSYEATVLDLGVFEMM